MLVPSCLWSCGSCSSCSCMNELVMRSCGTMPAFNVTRVSLALKTPAPPQLACYLVICLKKSYLCQLAQAMSYLTSEFWAFVICYRSSWRTHIFCINFEFSPVRNRTEHVTQSLEHWALCLISERIVEIGINAVLNKVHSPSWLWARMPLQRWLPLNLVLDPKTSISIWPKPNPTKRCPQHLQSTQNTNHSVYGLRIKSMIFPEKEIKQI